MYEDATVARGEAPGRECFARAGWSRWGPCTSGGEGSATLEAGTARVNTPTTGL